MNKTENKTIDLFKLQPQTQNSIELSQTIKTIKKIKKNLAWVGSQGAAQFSVSS